MFSLILNSGKVFCSWIEGNILFFFMKSGHISMVKYVWKDNLKIIELLKKYWSVFPIVIIELQINS